MDRFEINKESPIPLHEQLLNELRRLILTGELKPNTPVVSEPRLASTLNVSRTTIRQAWQVAEQEGLLYRVHGKGTYIAEPGQVRTGRLIGFLIPNFRSTFDSQLLSGAEGFLRERGYRVLFAHTDRNVPEENRLMSEMVQEGVIGFLLWPAMSTDSPRFLEELRTRNIPVVFLDRPVPGLDYPCVAANHYQGGVSAVKHLIGLGHKDIGFVARPHMALWSISERWRAYEDTMRAAGLPVRPPMLVGDTSELGTRHAQQYYTEIRGQEISQL
ncbi:MAG TPA: GntR family transcriptional regulator, partial [Aggregatilineales bacterium]|nr:GntR family transcriptional regulator [Aggregatilineales bacterium]